MSGEKPQVVIIAGPNGAGKSTLAPVLLRDTFGLLEFVNADTISAGLSAFNAEAVALAAGRVMRARLRGLADNKQSFAFESTLATRSYASWLRDLKRAGYEFHLLFLWLSLYSPLADTWAVYDNSGNRSPLLVATGEQQRNLKVIRPDLWQRLVEGRS